MKTDNSRLETRDGKIVSYIGTDGVTLFQAITLRSALRLWAEHRMLVNRQWTPTLMLTVAGRFSGNWGISAASSGWDIAGVPFLKSP